MNGFQEHIKNRRPELWTMLEEVRTQHQAKNLGELQTAINTEHKKAKADWDEGINRFGEAFRGAVEARRESTPPEKLVKRAEKRILGIKEAADRMLLLDTLRKELKKYRDEK